MTVYHGSIMEIRNPDISHSKRFLDFGPGFYVTSYREQAERWARRKCSRSWQPALSIVNVYELNEDFGTFSILRFGDVNEAWLDFVCDCRDGRDVYSAYDIIIGRVADDDVFRTIQSYRQGDITKERALELLKFSRPNDQFALRTERILTTNLAFLRSYSIPLEV